jgi:virginiamycin B lyase
VAEWNAGQLSVFDPADGSWRSWRPPGGTHAIYAVYVDERDIVWLSDFETDNVYSFNPVSEQFTAYANSGANGNVRQILGRPGEVWLPESGRDRLMVIRY